MWSFLKIYELATVAPRPIPTANNRGIPGGPILRFAALTCIPLRIGRKVAQAVSAREPFSTDAAIASWAMTSTAQPEPLQASQSNSQNQFTIATHDKAVNRVCSRNADREFYHHLECGSKAVLGQKLRGGGLSSPVGCTIIIATRPAFGCRSSEFNLDRNRRLRLAEHLRQTLH